MNVETENKCDVCGGSHHRHIKSKGYDDLYLTILKIGQARVSTGLKYGYLLDELKQHGYDIDNGCVLLAIQYWFFNSFYHLTNDDNPCMSPSDLKRHSGCSFILKGEASLVLIEHETMEKSMRQSRYAIRWAIIAVLVSLLSISEVHDWILNFFRKKESVEQSSIIRKSQRIVSTNIQHLTYYFNS